MAELVDAALVGTPKPERAGIVGLNPTATLNKSHCLPRVAGKWNTLLDTLKEHLA